MRKRQSDITENFILILRFISLTDLVITAQARLYIGLMKRIKKMSLSVDYLVKFGIEEIFQYKIRRKDKKL